MTTRTESVIYATHRIDATNMLHFLDAYNGGRPAAERVKLTHLFLAAIARTLYLRPELNRFIIGRRFYQHRDISITFAAKKEYTEDAPKTDIRITFRGTETLDQVRDMVNHRLFKVRSGHETHDDRLTKLVSGLPRPFLNILFGLLKWLDYHNILPRLFNEAIPLYTSVMAGKPRVNRPWRPIPPPV